MSEASVGIFFSVMGIGGLFGGIFSGMGTYTTRQALAITGITSVLGALFVMLFGLAGSVILAFPMLMLVGMLFEMEEIPAMTYFQNTLPESVYGRFFSLFLMIAAVGGVAGPLLAPILAERFSTAIALAILSVPAIICGSLFAVRGGGFRLSGHPFTTAAATTIAAEPTITPAPGALVADMDVLTDTIPEESLEPATVSASD